MNQKSVSAKLSIPLTDDELEELDQFLMSEATSDDTMMIDALDGYLTAIAVGPRALPMSEWLSGVWGTDKAHAPDFESPTDGQRIIDLIIRHLNGIIATLEQDPDTINPMFECLTNDETDDIRLDAAMWSYGFLTGVQLNWDDWEPMVNDSDGIKAFYPIYLLGDEDIGPEDKELIETPEQREALTAQIPGSVAWIYQFWQPSRLANDTCPCGSGQPFKECCGAVVALH